MKRAVVAAALLGLSASPLAAGGPGGHRSVSGAYVEARTAEVFTGGCIMNSEAETMGKQAVLAWKVDRGSFNGVRIDGLSVVAAVSGDRNLGMTEMGGEKPSVKSALFVDDRANAAQRTRQWHGAQPAPPRIGLPAVRRKTDGLRQDLLRSDRLRDVPGRVEQNCVDCDAECRGLIGLPILADNDPRRENRPIGAVQHQTGIGNIDPDVFRRQPPRQPALAFKVYLDLA